MRAELKDFYPVDFEKWHYWPEDEEDFGFPAEALIGPKDGRGEEIYSFWVCSPKWFAKNKIEKPRFVRHYFFMNEYDETTLKRLVEGFVNNTTAKTWSGITEKLSRFMFSEFEDYQESPKP